jgi:hypothetical protein
MNIFRLYFDVKEFKWLRRILEKFVTILKYILFVGSVVSAVNRDVRFHSLLGLEVGYKIGCLTRCRFLYSGYDGYRTQISQMELCEGNTNTAYS